MSKTFRHSSFSFFSYLVIALCFGLFSCSRVIKLIDNKPTSLGKEKTQSSTGVDHSLNENTQKRETTLINGLEKKVPVKESEVEENMASHKSLEIKESGKKKSTSKYPSLTREEKEHILADYCEKVEKTFTRYGWGKSNCQNYAWKFVRTSVKGEPLLWRTYGQPAENEAETEITLIMCGVHGDEITPIKFCYDVLDYMEKVTEGSISDPHTGKKASLKGKLVIVAPLVNPDSYFIKKPTRTNANGVDVNRNFPTYDFVKSAMKSWVSRYRKDKRRYPGTKAMSEPETIFQVNLIYRYQPDKIISVHAPLSMLDYDGPASEHTGGIVGSRANQLLIRMSEQAKGYRIKNYPFFPGSLGNYAGNERNIPTFTLELPTSDPGKTSSYWALFKDSIHSAVMHEIKGEGFVALDRDVKPLNGTRSN